MSDDHDEAAATFPVLCSHCLGPDPYVRMILKAHHSECRDCGRPFPVHRWQPRPRSGEPPKHTQVCRTCARLRTVCQCCVHHLDTGLTSAMNRVSAGGRVLGDTVSAANKDFQLADIERRAEALDAKQSVDVSKLITGGGNNSSYNGDGINSNANNCGNNGNANARGPKVVCNEWMRGECMLGSKCWKLHSVEGIPESQLLRTLFVVGCGKSDEATRKTIEKHFSKSLANSEKEQAKVSSDSVNTSSGNTDDDKEKADGKNGDDNSNNNKAEKEQEKETKPIESILRISFPKNREGRCFIEFSTRKAAERAMIDNGHGVKIGGRGVKVLWARSNGAGKDHHRANGNSNNNNYNYNNHNDSSNGNRNAGKRNDPFGGSAAKRKRVDPSALFPQYDATDPSNF